MATPPPDDSHDAHPAWIERVVAIAGALGANRVRVRWKLVRWVDARRAARRRRAQFTAHVAYAHRVCPQCGAVNARDEQACTRCAAPLLARPLEVMGRLGLVQVGAASVLLALVILAAYAQLALASHSGWTISTMALVRHGANLPRGFADDEPWRYATSTLLHLGMWHLGFNLFALAVLGPRCERAYGSLATLFAFLATGVLASIASQLTGLDAPAAGASGALMGLTGLVAATAHREGTTIGRNERNAMLRWFAYTIVFGYFVGADNRAHLAGFVAGAAIGLIVPPRARGGRIARAIGRGLGGLALIAIAGTLFLVLVPPGGERTQLPGGGDAIANDYALCKAAGSLDPDQAAQLGDVDDACARVDEVRASCARRVPDFLDGPARLRECGLLHAFDQGAIDTGL